MMIWLHLFPGFYAIETWKQVQKILAHRGFLWVTPTVGSLEAIWLNGHSGRISEVAKTNLLALLTNSLKNDFVP